MGGGFRAVVDVGHELAGDLVALLGAVAHAQLDVELGEAHDAEPDLPHLSDLLFDLRHREVAHRDDVLEEASPQFDAAVELLEVDGLLEIGVHRFFLRVVLGLVLGRPDPPVGRVARGERREVDVAEVAGLVLFERLLAAGVRREDPVVGVFLDVEGVLLVDAFEVDDAGFAVLVGPVDDVLPERLGGDREDLADLDVLAEVVALVDFLRLGRGDVRFLGSGVRERELAARLAARP